MDMGDVFVEQVKNTKGTFMGLVSYIVHNDEVDDETTHAMLEAIWSYTLNLIDPRSTGDV